jgi:autotransporter-associated beta strand protein
MPAGSKTAAAAAPRRNQSVNVGNLDNTNTAGLVKAGPGTLILAGAANAYAGNTTVSSGTLQIGDGCGRAVCRATWSLRNTTGLTFNSTVDQTYAGLIFGTGRLTKAGAGRHAHALRRWERGEPRPHPYQRRRSIPDRSLRAGGLVPEHSPTPETGKS